MNEIEILLGVAIPYPLVEKIRLFLKKHGLINNSFSFQYEKELVLIPTISLDKKELVSILQKTPYYNDINIIEAGFKRKKKKITNLSDYLREILPNTLHKYIPKSFDLIGDIAIIEIKKELQTYKKQIGEALISLFPSIKTVFQKCSAVNGEFRIRELKLIAGVNKCETIHLEHGVRLFVNVCNTYFSPRLGAEHLRIARLCQEGEVIADLFTGVGSFPVHITKNKRAKVYAIDINPEAIKCLKRSLKLNRLVGEVIPICDDVRNAVMRIPKADRVIMNLPKNSHNFIDVLCTISKSGAVVHFYHFVPESNAQEYATKLLQNGLNQHGWMVTRILRFQKVRESAPHELHIRLDAKIKPIKQQ